MPKYTAETADIHELYEKAVQCVDADIDFVEEVYVRLHGRKPRLLKEDFCGTAGAAVEFVKRHPDNRVIAVDLDAEVLEWGRARHVEDLGERKKDITLLHENVLNVTSPEVDVILGMNFSYFIFKKREALKEYFASCLSSLKPGGMLFLDAYGGSEAGVPQKEKKKFKGFNYVWEQHYYNPINSDVINYIHFHFPDGTKIKKAFEYHWRFWSPREITELLQEVGFEYADVYWEGWDEENEEGDGDFTKVHEAENCEGWICYIVGGKK